MLGDVQCNIWLHSPRLVCQGRLSTTRQMIGTVGGSNDVDHRIVTS